MVQVEIPTPYSCKDYMEGLSFLGSSLFLVYVKSLRGGEYLLSLSVCSEVGNRTSSKGKLANPWGGGGW